MFVDDNNSDGFGGIVPLSKICKFGILVSFIYFFAFSKFSNLFSVISFIKSDNPSPVWFSNIWLLPFGVLKFVSTIRTFLFEQKLLLYYLL